MADMNNQNPSKGPKIEVGEGFSIGERFWNHLQDDSLQSANKGKEKYSYWWNINHHVCMAIIFLLLNVYNLASLSTLECSNQSNNGMLFEIIHIL